MTFELHCMASELKAAIAVASSVTDSGVKVPVLKSTRIEVDGKTATFIATNMDHAIRAFVGAEGHGTVHLETAALSQKASALRQDRPVKMIADDEGKFVTVTQDKTRWRLPIIVGDSFPHEFTRPVDGDPVTINRAKLFAAISGVLPIINPMESAFTIGQGIYFDMTEGFRVIGAANRGLSVMQIDAPSLANSVIVPLSTVRAIMSIFRDHDNIDITVTPDAIGIRTEYISYKSKLIDATYPDWRKIGEFQMKTMVGTATVYVENFLDAIDRAAAISEDKTKSGSAIGAKLTFGNGECSIATKNRAGEEGEDFAECSGDDGEIGVAIENFKYGISSVGGQKVAISFGPMGGKQAMVIRPEPAPEMDNYRVVMGMMV